MRYDTILFDLDGTLTESGNGIIRSAAHACEAAGFSVPSDDALRSFIGPPLIGSFMAHAGMTESEARHAVELYRERYDAVGWRELRVYAGIAPLLRALKKHGCYLAIASAKPEIFVRRIAENFGFARYFDAIVGIHAETVSDDKCELLRQALPEKYDPARTAMIGDRSYDLEAAKRLGVAAIGAAYGYGSRDELRSAGADAIVDSPNALFELLLPGETRERGCFITFEGADGCGKSTQMRLLADALSERGWEIVTSREPGGCAISEAIRGVVLDIRNKGMSNECEALLFAAARAQHVRDTILPAIQSGKIVLCDRYLDSSLAYQARGRELGDDFIRLINAPAKIAVPDRTLLFVGNQAKVSARLRSNSDLDRMEVETDSFVTRVYRGFDDLAHAEPERIHVIDSDRAIDDIFTDVLEDVENLLNR